MSKELAVKTSYGLVEPITSNDIPVCPDCGCRITVENNSGWEVFTSDGRTTQPICVSCDKARMDSFPNKKAL